MKKQTSIDGFVPRRASKAAKLGVEPVEPQKGRTTTPTLERAHSRGGLTRSEVDESLRSIDDEANENKSATKRNTAKVHIPRKKIIKRVVLTLVIIIVLALGWFVVKTILAGADIFKGDLLGLVQQKELKKDANGRSNILVLGTSEDDPGHEASYLTDSLMVLSVDQEQKNAYMISIPRDLYVEYGKACLSGYSGKINEYFNCINSDWDSSRAEDERQEASRKFFGDIVGLDIQYSVHVNYTVMRDLVSALGGIKVTIESRDPRGQMDSNFDWKCKGGNENASRATMIQNCPPNGHYIDYPNGEVELDAEHALYLAQARGDSAPTYGFEQSNFDREKNQQKILVAIKEKAMSAGTLTNFSKVTGIIEALGKNLRTNFETSEIRTLMSLANDIPSSAIKSISLIDADPALVTTSNIGGASVVVPTAGTYDYSKIQAYISKQVNATPVSQEAAHVVVLNASGVAGAAQKEADRLEKLGLVVDSVDNAPEGGSYAKNKIYQLSDNKLNTLAKLESLYGVKATKETVPVSVEAATNFVVIVADATQE
ncbi:MAG: LCP family protein [Candidatus Saccharimonas sp.]